MCKNCQASALGQQRQTALEAAAEAVRAAGIRPDAVSSFLARYGVCRDAHGRPGGYIYTDAQRAALRRYSAAEDAIKELHRDYVIDAMSRAPGPAIVWAMPADGGPCTVEIVAPAREEG